MRVREGAGAGGSPSLILRLNEPVVPEEGIECVESHCQLLFLSFLFTSHISHVPLPTT